MAHCREAQLTELYDELLLVRHAVVMPQSSCRVSVPQSPEDFFNFFSFACNRFSPCYRTLAPVWPPLVLLLTKLALVFLKNPHRCPQSPRTCSAFSHSSVICFSLTKPERTQFDETSAATLEAWIDAHDEHLPELKNFILPSGNAASSALHIARTVRLRRGGGQANPSACLRLRGPFLIPLPRSLICSPAPLQACRRAERRVVELAQVDDVDESAMKFINRYARSAAESPTTSFFVFSFYPYICLHRPSD